MPYIFSLLDDIEVKTILDGFSGTTRVSQALAKSGYQIISNDISSWSYVFGICYLQNKQPKNYYHELITHLNNIPGYAGWFTEHYGGIDISGSATQKTGLKKPWQIHNTKKLDGIRDEIDLLQLNEIDKSVALTSLILALDRVDNTLGHFTSYLKNWSDRSYKTLELKIPDIFENKFDNIVLQKDIFDVLSDYVVDFAYFDPPYGSNNEKMPPSRVRYAAYYHLWTTICKNDKPDLFGVALRRKDTSDKIAISLFEEFKKTEDNKFIAIQAIDRLIKNTNATYIALSYSSGGKATAEELKTILINNGELLKIFELDYKKHVMAEMHWSNEWIPTIATPHKEFLFLLKK